jgi:hypothetical protein
MRAHGTEPQESRPAQTRPSWQLPGGTPGGLITDGMHAVDSTLRRGGPGSLARWPLVASRQAIVGLLCSNGLPAGRDWLRRRRTDQLRDLVSCSMSK